MTNVLKVHKIVGRLNPNERVHLQEMVDSNIPPRQMFTNLRKRNNTTSTTIKHVYNGCHRYRRSIRGTKNDMPHLLKSLVDNGYVYHCRKYRDSDDVSDVFGHIQILSSCLTRSPPCLCLIPSIRPTSIVFHCLSLSVTPLP